ncbi:FliI/YscN family ATPase [Legionella israelensis]|uniref:FliI/YscN family ATPase n=1 Tax=Legionella israelensis TaxID=454 RepID=UPI00163D9027|nr:FliI/YscN family ATPase [Legionella israelensis]
MTLRTALQQLKRKSSHSINDLEITGTVVRISGVLLEAHGLKVAIGSICKIKFSVHDEAGLLAEVIGFAGQSTFLMTFAEPYGILPGAEIQWIASSFMVPVGPSLMGRVINGFCLPIDNKGALETLIHYPTTSPAINPIDRKRISEPLDVGIKAINGLITVGMGQRLGIFAGSGVGKSVLLGMMTRYSQVQVIVVGLIGERGREVKEFIEENIGENHLKKTVILAAPSDASPLERTNGVLCAASIAAYFRDQGMDVLLIVDSLTRYAQALRQIYLLLGEPPSTRGYSPSVFSKISQLIERCGYGHDGKGSITAFFTVLTEGDDQNDPVADHARSILDGHIVLSRKLAEAAHYPAIQISTSISRVMPSVVDKKHHMLAMRFKQLYAHLMENQDLVSMGMYKEGSDPLLDEALKKQSAMFNFLKQEVDERQTFSETLAQLENLLKES